ncbi:MAG: sulfatase [Gemmatimonadetes bacterium]|nr:sulfatase [Gemmatimonadota bacterium]MBT7862288.1 sulfatase [Gemmatimonadota bacterium]
MTDDHTVQEMGCYGSAMPPTPHLDRIAAGGTRFDNAFCTNALCAPSRATVLTGAFSHIHGIRGNSEGADNVEELSADVPTFPELLRDAGYRTGLVGKYHIRQAPRGFDYWCIHPGQGEYFDPEFIDNGQRRRIQGYATDITGDLALEFLNGVDDDEPFCLVYQFKAPHRPFQPAPRHAGLFEEIEPTQPATIDDDYEGRRIAGLAQDMQFDVSLAPDYDDLPEGMTDEARRDWIYGRFIRDRWRTMVGVDENVGRVLDWLDENSRADDTLVIYTSDHGYFLGEHGWYDKRFMYDPAIRIPFVARCPTESAVGHVASEMVMNVDVAPTILDFAGVEIPPTVQGRSLRPLMAASAPDDWRQEVYYAYYEDSWRLRDTDIDQMAEPGFKYFTPHRIGPHRGIRTASHKLIEYLGEVDDAGRPLPYWEFFDLVADPDELDNRYDDPDCAQTIADLRQRLRELQVEYGDR